MEVKCQKCLGSGIEFHHENPEKFARLCDKCQGEGKIYYHDKIYDTTKHENADFLEGIILAILGAISISLYF